MEDCYPAPEGVLRRLHQARYEYNRRHGLAKDLGYAWWHPDYSILYKRQETVIKTKDKENNFVFVASEKWELPPYSLY